MAEVLAISGKGKGELAAVADAVMNILKL